MQSRRLDLLGAPLGCLIVLFASGCGKNSDEPTTSSTSSEGGGSSAASGLGSGGSGSTSASSGGPTPLPTGRFRIGVWCGLPASMNTSDRMAEMANAGFTTTSYGCQGDTSSMAYNTTMLSLAHDAGMDAIVLDPRVPAALAGTDVQNNLDGVTHDFANVPGMAGYFVTDEPTAPFDNLASIVNGLQSRDPTHFAYTNLLPVYASEGQLGYASYDDYVATYFSQAMPRVISFDDYPFLTGSDDTTFFIDLAEMRSHAVAANVPFWQFIQSITFNGHRATTLSEKLWEGTQTLAYGGAGVSYFTYWTPNGDEGFGQGIVDISGNETPQYADVKAINARLQAFGRYLVAAHSTSVFHDGALPAGTVTRSAYASIYLPNNLPVTVGLFDVNDGQYGFLANRDYTNAVESDVWVASNGTPESLDVGSGVFTAMTVLETDPIKGQRVHVSIAAGDGALIHMLGPVPAGAPGAEAFVGTVRSNSAMLDVVDSSFGDGPIGQESWNYCPDGYDLGGNYFTENGFWICTRKDLSARTFYVGNVVSDQAMVFKIAGGSATAVGPEGWNTCPGGSLLGRRFESNGYWLCLE